MHKHMPRTHTSHSQSRSSGDFWEAFGSWQTDRVSQLTLIGWEFQKGDNWTNEAEDEDSDSQDTSSIVLNFI